MNLDYFMSLINGSTDAKALLNALLQTNPRLKPIYNQMRSSGMSEKDFVMNFAKQNNVNIEPLLDMFKSKGIKL